MSEAPSQEDNSPQVVIIGAGLGGLMLGAVLETANIKYHIFERATEVRPLGSAISLLGNVLPIFEQLGIYEDLEKISFPHIAMDFYDNKLKKTGTVEINDHDTMQVDICCGYDMRILSRPKLYELIRSRVPEHKVSLGKKVLRTKEENDKVTIYCSDNTTYECDILIGADGAYSVVRNNMYKQLEEQEKLPSCDKDDFSIGYYAVVGVASPPNPEKYPELSDGRCHFRLHVGDNNATSCTMSVPDNQICWGLQIQLPSSQRREHHFHNSEWGPEAIDDVIKDFKDLPCPSGGTMKEIFDATPTKLISKVFLEEKVFKTWYHGRTVLIGDAPFVLSPQYHSVSQGAVMAMKDAVVLANCIFNMKDNSNQSVKAAFESYYNQRSPEAEIVYQTGIVMSKIMAGQKWFERALRYVMLNFTPYWIMQKLQVEAMAYRPQINWLPLVEGRGTGKVHPQVGREEAAAKIAHVI
ncbi:hypothetical protein BGZ49_008232 [Haplosporangium sp. Z 27]|nr:hypothetical protein BGZ49_008232 [Haplosporangium sp. Z 27]